MAVSVRPRLIMPGLNTFTKYQLKLLGNPIMNESSYMRFKCSQSSYSFLGLSYRQESWSPKELDLPSASRACTPLGAAKSELAERNAGELSQALWTFLRPHTARGTILASVAVAARTWMENVNALTWSISLKTFFGLLAIVCAHGYIVGINQIYDVEIDKVNKPYLPVANGDFSIREAWLLVTMFAVIGGLIIWMLNYGPIMALLYSFILFMGTIYSVPPFRMKRFPVAAFLIISPVRGFVITYTAHHAARTALGLPSGLCLPMVFITTFATVFALAVSILKDLPDTEGDKKFNIPTFATNFGVRNIAFLGSTLVLLNYLGAITVAIFNPQVFRRSFMILAHVILAFCLIFQASLLEQKNYTKEASTTFYQFVWKLFCAEFIIYPFI